MVLILKTSNISNRKQWLSEILFEHYEDFRTKQTKRLSSYNPKFLILTSVMFCYKLIHKPACSKLPVSNNR